MIRSREFPVFYTARARSDSFDKWRRSGFGAVSVVGSMQAVEDEHGCNHVLDTVVAVGEVVHGFVLFVNDSDAGFVGSDDDGFDIFGCLALRFECSIDFFGGFDRSL